MFLAFNKNIRYSDALNFNKISPLWHCRSQYCETYISINHQRFFTVVGTEKVRKLAKHFKYVSWPNIWENPHCTWWKLGLSFKIKFFMYFQQNPLCQQLISAPVPANAHVSTDSYVKMCNNAGDDQLRCSILQSFALATYNDFQAIFSAVQFCGKCINTMRLLEKHTNL